MRLPTVRAFKLAASFATVLSVVAVAAEKPPRVGPETEKRFPPLKVPPGFKATLFACDPLIEYPSVIALGPRPRSLFVAADFVTGLGVEIVRRDEIRLIEDTDGDGYADKATVYASGFNSIQGLAYHDGAVYVMHAPFLTVLRDTDGDGKADERRDLLTGLGLPPEKNPSRLHCANGVVPGHDGWLYLALGDNGCDVPRPEGDRLVLQGGGILRCRPDGRDLHVFATGLRNIYDVALDAALNVFVRDNENDGGDYKIRVCHSFFNADHGYPYLYYERPDEALPPLADLGLGSSAGGVCYLESAFPSEYRGNLFFCEWGRSVVRYRPEQAGSAFAPLKEVEFAAGADNDPYGFKPTDLVVERDGSLLVSDWADGQRPRRGRGRIYRIAYADGRTSTPKPLPADAGLEQWITQLDAESYHERTLAQTMIERRGREGGTALRAALAAGRIGVRGRLHAVWILARPGGQEATGELLSMAKTDRDPQVQAQAVRAIADLADPVLARHRLDAGPGDTSLAAHLASLTRGRDPQILLEVVVAVGRLRWPQAPAWLRSTLTSLDPALAHAAQQTLRQSNNWPAVLKLLDEPSASPIRAVALRAVAARFVPEVVDGLIERLGKEPDTARRQAYADALTRVYKKTGPWVYWGYRPAPRPPNTVAWERTEAIERALDHLLADPDRQVRLAILRRIQREKIPVRPATLDRWLRDERQAEGVAAILESLRERPAAEVRGPLAAVVREKTHAAANRLTALSLFADRLDESSAPQLLHLAGSVEEGPVLAEILRRIGKWPRLGAIPLLLQKLGLRDAEVRAAAIGALADVQAVEARDLVRTFLEDRDPRVRRAAALAAGKLADLPATESLLRLARDPDPGVRRVSFEVLRTFREPRVLPLAVAALTDGETELAALACVGELGGPDQASAIVESAKRHPSAEVLSQVVRILTTWGGREGLSAARRRELNGAIGEVQGTQGVLLHWHTLGPLPAQGASHIVGQFASAEQSLGGASGKLSGWHTSLAPGTESPVKLGTTKGTDAASAWFGYTDFILPEPAKVQFLAGSSGTLRVWLNGRPAFQRDQPLPFRLDSDQFTAPLVKGQNRLLVQVASPKGEAEFHLRFRRQSTSAEHEKLAQAALARRGDPELGHKLFLNAEKTQCVKCHRLGDQGERIGPELTGAGSRFTRIYLIESILEPSRTIAPSFQTVAVALKSGQIVIGIPVAETEAQLTLADNQGQKHALAKADIEERRAHPLSTMPEGLEKRLTTDEFVDLIAFLVSQKETHGR